MGIRPPYETFKNPTCRGSYSLGTACGHCEKCEWEKSLGRKSPKTIPIPKEILDEVRGALWKSREVMASFYVEDPSMDECCEECGFNPAGANSYLNINISKLEDLLTKLQAHMEG